MMAVCLCMCMIGADKGCNPMLPSARVEDVRALDEKLGWLVKDDTSNLHRSKESRTESVETDFTDDSTVDDAFSSTTESGVAVSKVDLPPAYNDVVHVGT